MENPSLDSRGPVIYINVFPGTGKPIIAKHLVSLFQTDAVKLVHHQLLINPTDAVLDRDQPGYQELCRNIRQTVLNSLAENTATHSSAYIFTDFQSANELGSEVSLEYFNCAVQRGCHFIPITPRCSEEENLKRLTSDDRATHGKLVDVELAKQLRKDDGLFTFVGYCNRRTLNVTKFSAEEVAVEIMHHVIKIAPAMGLRVRDQESAPLQENI
ncbi:hypothetical protein CEP54_009658 [Fusarium duplospermum]|uniref:Uncharacterized protein n=1 Tax=Fusarium duplospermum TaxID=1325734 RepID=A0A428PPL2_9HYPO|nr:hypothetical protein CEP54_009658 [Fusarium duplospermum]